MLLCYTNNCRLFLIIMKCSKLSCQYILHSGVSNIDSIFALDNQWSSQWCGLFPFAYVYDEDDDDNDDDDGDDYDDNGDYNDNFNAVACLHLDMQVR